MTPRFPKQSAMKALFTESCELFARHMENWTPSTDFPSAKIGDRVAVRIPPRYRKFHASEPMDDVEYYAWTAV